MWFALGFTAACALGAYWDIPWLMTGVICLALLGALCMGLSLKIRHFRIGTAIFLGAAVGLLWFSVFSGFGLNVARHADGKTLPVTIRASNYGYETTYGSAVDGEVTLAGKTYRVRAYLNEKRLLEPGQQAQGHFRLRLTTGGEEEPVYHRGNGIFLLAYQDGEVTYMESTTLNLWERISVWRQKIVTILDDAFPDDAQGFARALLLGDRTEIDYETETNFKSSGIIHIIAVSGLHVTVLFGLIYLITGKRRLLTVLLGLPALFLFAALASFTPSITRACIMQAVLMAAMLFGKEYDPMTSLAFAALAMLTVNPMVITSVSFQLSAGCMAGIFLFGQPLRLWFMDEKRLGRWKGRFTNWLASSVSITLSATVFTAPLTAIHFGTVSLVGVLTNLLTLWVVTFIFYGILLICVAGFFSGAVAAFLGSVLAWPIRYVLSAAAVFGNVPLASVYTDSVYIVFWLILIYILLAVFLLGKSKPAALFAAMVTGGLIAALICSWAEPMMDSCRMTMLDVGQGQAILLQSEGKTFLVDCGSNDCEDAADTTAQQLLSQGIRKLDGILLTHYDSDHAGGLEYLLTRIETQALFLPYALDDGGVGEKLGRISGVEPYLVAEDTEIRYGGVCITLFAPVSFDSGNESSMCILFQTEKCDILITGDSGTAVERVLLERNDLPELEVLVAGHHGSKNSTSRELLEATSPKFVFISVSRDNPYGHPADETLRRLQEYGCVVYRTDENGTIRFRR